MPKFDQTSFSKLAKCHPDLQVLFYEVIKHVECVITEGHKYTEKYESSGSLDEHINTNSMDVYVIPFTNEFFGREQSLWFGGYVGGIAQKLKDEGKIVHSIRCGSHCKGIEQLNESPKINDIVYFELVE